MEQNIACKLTLERTHMHYVDLPPECPPQAGPGTVGFPEIGICSEIDLDLTVRKACVSDVQEVMKLINGFAVSKLMLPRGPRTLYENIRDFIVVCNESDGENDGQDGSASGKKETIIACGGLHVLWGDMAEIRSVAVHPVFHRRGLGTRLVQYMEKDARRLGIKKLFTFTLAEEFFRSLGFEARSREQLPHVVWAECSCCPKFFNCDEIGMIKEL
ncbi:MAG: N-acetyltransferase [Desulfobacterales bacterium]|nr:N-acetyltransferase [Desulfobacterales bacterium]MDD4072678.1 N-acetyltransferase [Desulfobacterales bacterium]MDD4391871.1 N-acetyltransferase [Desulfobacterales bacterium]